MKRFTLTVALVLAGPCASLTPRVAAQDNPAATQAAAATVEAANRFLATLDEAQRGKMIFDYNDEAQRKRWSNFPSPMFQRAGLRLGDLTAAQRSAAMSLLAAAFSPSGYEKIVQIVEADEVLKNGSGGGGGGGNGRGPGGGGGNAGGGRGGPGGGRGGGGNLNFGHDNYLLAFLGHPSATTPWMLQFGGHHLGVNLTLVGSHGTLAPSHTGAQPAIYEIEGKTIRPLGREVDKAHALLTSLDEAQRKQAILGFQMRDLVLGPGRDGQTIQPEGIKGSALTERQREMMLDVASEWTGIMAEPLAQAKLAEMKSHLADTWFAWSGPTEAGKAAYFRIQGPTVLIEFAPQTLGGDATKHIHTIYRDPTNEYGTKWTKP